MRQGNTEWTLTVKKYCSTETDCFTEALLNFLISSGFLKNTDKNNSGEKVYLTFYLWESQSKNYSHHIHSKEQTEMDSWK